MALAMTLSMNAPAWPRTPAPARRFVPAMPTLWPAMLSPGGRATAFPFGAPRATFYYLARNALFHGARLLGLEGREVLVPAYHHGVEVGALVAAGARPVFVRVDASMRLDLDDAERRCGPRTAALHVIHYAGFPQPMADVLALAHRRGLRVIEDCALSLFASDRGRPLGARGDLAIFCLYKTLPVPNGGVLVVNDPALPPVAPPDGAPLVSTLSHATGALLGNLALRLGPPGEALRGAARRGYAAVRGASGLSAISTGTMRFDPAHVDLGMSRLSWRIARHADAARIVAARRRNYALLLARLRDVAPPIHEVLAPGAAPLFYPLLCPDKARVAGRLAAAGIETVDFWARGHPLCPEERFPEVARLRRQVLELPCHQDLGPEDVAWVARCAREALG